MIDPNSVDTEGDGEWGPVVDNVVIPIHSIVLPDGKVFSFGTDDKGMQGGQFIYSLFDPETGEVKILENRTDTNIFCSYMSFDPVTGNVIIMGGDAYRTEQATGEYSGVADVNIFDYETQTIRPSETGDMAYARWYGTSITMANGEILIVGGRDENYNGSTIPEIYNAETGFRELPGANIPDLDDNAGRLYATFWYPHLWQASDGDIWMIEAEGRDQDRGDVWKIGVDGEGSAQKVATLPFDARNTTPSIMYDVDKVLIAANDGWVWSGDLSTEVPSWEKAFFMPDETGRNEGSARTNGNFVILPDGRVLVVGGGEAETILGNQLEDAQYGVIVWDPETGETEEWADVGLARLYHSSGLILPDATVYAGGGGAPGPLQNDNFEIFKPPYLYDDDGELAERPEISEAPKNIAAGDTFTIQVDDASDIEAVNAVRSGGSTHARNSDARIVKLAFEIVDDTTIEIATPGNLVMSPGVYMLFAIDQAGVPSRASMLGVDFAPLVETGGLEAGPPGIEDLRTLFGDDEIATLVGAIDEPVFELLSSFGNGLVDRSRSASEAAASQIEDAGAAFLAAIGADPDLVTGDVPLSSPLLKPLSGAFDALFEGLRDRANAFGDQIGDVTNAVVSDLASLGNGLDDFTGEPTPVIDALEQLTVITGGGLAYAMPLVLEAVVDVFDTAADTALGVLDGVLGSGSGFGSSAFGLFGPDGIDLSLFDGASGIFGLGETSAGPTARGDNLVYTGAAGTVEAGDGGDLVTLYRGADTVDLGGALDLFANALALNGGRLGQLIGSGGQDSVGLGLGSLVKRIDLYDGDDLVMAGGEIGTLRTGRGDDEVMAATVGTVRLGAGDDAIVAGTVTGKVHGGGGNDYIEIGSGHADGGRGNDTFLFVPGGGPVSLQGGPGYDRLLIDLDEAGITRGDLVRDLGVRDWSGDVSIWWGKSVRSDALDLDLTGIELIELL